MFNMEWSRWRGYRRSTGVGFLDFWGVKAERFVLHRISWGREREVPRNIRWIKNWNTKFKLNYLIRKLPIKFVKEQNERKMYTPPYRKGEFF